MIKGGQIISFETPTGICRGVADPFTDGAAAIDLDYQSKLILKKALVQSAIDKVGISENSLWVTVFVDAFSHFHQFKIVDIELP